MTPTLRRFFQLALLLIGMASASAALALSNVEVVPTGPQAGQTTLRLFDNAGKPVMPDPANPNRYRNLQPGNYTTETSVSGKTVGSRGTVRLEDGNNQLRVDSVTGTVEVIRQIVFLQQQQAAWGFGLYGGLKRTPFDGEFRSQALGMGGSTDLDEDGYLLGVEARYYLRRLRQQQWLGAQLFLYGSYVEYFGTDKERRFLDLHPPVGENDSGLRVDEKHSVRYAVGGRWNLAQQIGFELMLGGHATKVRGTVFSDESGGGGSFNSFSRSKWLWGPMFAVGLTYPLWKFASGRPVLGFVRWSGLYMDDFKVSGQSSPFNFDYHGRFDGGWNHALYAGAQF